MAGAGFDLRDRDDTSANVVLVTEAPTHLTARGQSRVHLGDTPVPEIGTRLRSLEPSNTLPTS